MCVLLAANPRVRMNPTTLDLSGTKREEGVALDAPLRHKKKGVFEVKEQWRKRSAKHPAPLPCSELCLGCRRTAPTELRSSGAASPADHAVAEADWIPNRKTFCYPKVQSALQKLTILLAFHP